MKIETAGQLAQMCRAAAQRKTLYVYGAFGCPLTEENKQRILRGYAYNRRTDRKAKIQSADADTFGFDCSGLIKGILWGWKGETDSRYGGAVYGANDVKDQNADTIIKSCLQLSEDFSCLQVGEVVWMPGHIGVYVGDSLVAESSPKWADGVQLTACNCQKEGYNSRAWKKHGKFPTLCSAEAVRLELPTLRRGDAGETVKALQRLLFAMGSPIGSKNPIDGSFGPKTEAAVLTFCRKQELPATAAVDQVVWKALLGV